MKKIIGYISAQNPFTDRKAWSGTIYKIREAIENGGLFYKLDRCLECFECSNG